MYFSISILLDSEFSMNVTRHVTQCFHDDCACRCINGCPASCNGFLPASFRSVDRKAVLHVCCQGAFRWVDEKSVATFSTNDFSVFFCPHKSGWVGNGFDMFLAEAHSSELSRNRQLLRFCHASEDFLFFLFYLFVFERRRMGNTLIVRMFLDRFAAD